MSIQVQYRRGTATQNNAFVGALAEITVDTTNKTLRVHDGATAGGSNLATVAYVTSSLDAVANIIEDGTSNVKVTTTDGNVAVTIGGVANVAVFSSSGANVTGYVTATGNITGGNINTAGQVIATGNISGGNLSGTSIVGTLTTASQTNITSVGTLGSLSVTGNISGGNVSTASVNASSSNMTITAAAGDNSVLLVPTGTGTVDTASKKITNVADPTASQDAATKSYVDSIAAEGVHYHASVRVESPIALTVTYNNGSSGVGATLTNAGTQAALVIDGVTMIVADRVLIYEQSDARQNGVYTVTNVGSGSTNWVLTRATDADTYAPSDPDALGQGDAFFVREGDTGIGETYVCNTEGTITFGTTNITFVQISSAQIYSAGTGLTLTTTVFSVNATQNLTTLNSTNVTSTNVTASSSLTTPSITKSGSNGSGNIGQSDNYFNTIFAKATSALYADLAELYTSDIKYPPGTVLVFGGDAEVTQSTESHSSKIAGVTSTNPAHVMNSSLVSANTAIVALVGRVPCKVVGTVRKGECLTSSELPGVARALNATQYQPGVVIGKALQDYNSNEPGIIEVVVGRL